MNILVGLTAVALLLSIIIPFGVYFIGEKKSNKFKSMLLVNVISFFGILIISTVFLFGGGIAQAAETGEVVSNVAGWAYIAAGLVTGMATIGTGIAVSSAASAALGALSEDSSMMGKALIFVAMAEGIALYGLLISFMILMRV